MRSSADPPSRPNMNFGKTLLDRSLRPNLRVKDSTFYSIPLPKPLQPTPYTPPKPVPKRRTKRGPIALPRTVVPKKVTEKVQRIKKLIDEIAPYYVLKLLVNLRKI